MPGVWWRIPCLVKSPNDLLGFVQLVLLWTIQRVFHLWKTIQKNHWFFWKWWEEWMKPVRKSKGSGSFRWSDRSDDEIYVKGWGESRHALMVPWCLWIIEYFSQKNCTKHISNTTGNVLECIFILNVFLGSVYVFMYLHSNIFINITIACYCNGDVISYKTILL